MTFRAKSRLQQWTLWSCGALVALFAYVLVSQLALGRVSFNLFDPRYYRIAMPVIALFSLFAWETRWDGEKARGEGEGEERRTKGDATFLSREDKEDTSSSHAARMPRPLCALSTKESAHHCQPQPSTSTSTSAAADAATGAALYAKARKIPHQEIPDYESDGLYLDLVGDAATAGYAPAMAKLGEYARRREAWVEAYYWTWRARKGGMEGLDAVIRDIRQCWMSEGSPDESDNVYELFSEEAWSVGRALLDMDSGRDVSSAKAFLKTHYPELVE